MVKVLNLFSSWSNHTLILMETNIKVLEDDATYNHNFGLSGRKLAHLMDNLTMVHILSLVQILNNIEC